LKIKNLELNFSSQTNNFNNVLDDKGLKYFKDVKEIEVLKFNIGHNKLNDQLYHFENLKELEHLKELDWNMENLKNILGKPFEDFSPLSEIG